MDQATSTDVSGGGLPASQPASQPVASAPAGNQSGSVDASGTNGATAPPAGSTGQQPVAPTGVAASEPPAKPESALPFPEDDSDLRGREHERGNVGVVNLRKMYRELHNDHQTLKPHAERYGSLLEQYGSEEEITRRLGYYDKLSQRTNETDPNTGLPVISAQPFVADLYSNNRPAFDRMFQASWQQPIDEAGTTFGERVFESVLRTVGVEPEEFERWVEGGKQMAVDNRTASASANKPVSAEELSHIPEQYHEAFKQLAPGIREKLLYDYEETERDAFLADKQQSIETQKQLDQVKQQQEAIKRQQQQFERQAQEAFMRDVQQATEAFVGDLRKEVATGIIGHLGNEWKPTENDQTNQALYGFVNQTLFNLLTPELRPLTEQFMQSVGVQLDPDMDQLLDELTAVAQEVTVRGKIAQNPRLSAMHDQAALSEAQRVYEGLKKRVQGRANKYALQLAQPLMGVLGNLAKKEGAQLDEARSGRPTVNGTGQGNVNLPAPRSYEELSRQRYGLQ